jgi:hypothetical protein
MRKWRETMSKRRMWWANEGERWENEGMWEANDVPKEQTKG